MDRLLRTGIYDGRVKRIRRILRIRRIFFFSNGGTAVPIKKDPPNPLNPPNLFEPSDIDA